MLIYVPPGQIDIHVDEFHDNTITLPWLQSFIFHCKRIRGISYCYEWDLEKQVYNQDFIHFGSIKIHYDDGRKPYSNMLSYIVTKDFNILFYRPTEVFFVMPTTLLGQWLLYSFNNRNLNDLLQSIETDL